MEVTVALPLSEDALAYRRAEELGLELLKASGDERQVVLLLPPSSHRRVDTDSELEMGWSPRMIKVRASRADLFGGIEALEPFRSTSVVLWLGNPHYHVSVVKRLIAATRRYDFVWTRMGQGSWSRWRRRLLRYSGLSLACPNWFKEPTIWSAVPEFLSQLPTNLPFNHWESFAKDKSFRHARLTLPESPFVDQWPERDARAAERSRPLRASSRRTA